MATSGKPVRAKIPSSTPYIPRVGPDSNSAATSARIAPATHAPSNLETVDSGHQDVEDDGVGLVGLQAVQRLAAIGGVLDLVTLELERAAERLADSAFVVDDEDPHASIVAPIPGLCAVLIEFLGTFHLLLRPR